MIYDYGNHYALIKKIEAGGNAIPSMNRAPIVDISEEKDDSLSDCPMLHLMLKGDQYEVSCWDWVPGPGPGDFCLPFSTENAAIDFVLTYFFEENPYFEARKVYERNSRDSITLPEIRAVFEQVCTTLEQAFSNEEIALWRHPFHKMPLDTWRTERFESETPDVQVGLAFLPNEVRALRSKIQEQEAFTYQEVRDVADLLLDLSIRLKERMPE